MMKKRMDDSSKVSLPFGSGRITADFADSPVRVLAPAPSCQTTSHRNRYDTASAQGPRASSSEREVPRELLGLAGLTILSGIGSVSTTM